jgi:hypothetical protein
MVQKSNWFGDFAVLCPCASRPVALPIKIGREESPGNTERHTS